LIFYSNGFEHWLWDDVVAPPRQVAGFLSRDALELAIQRRTPALPLAQVAINPDIAVRYYQERAIRKICEAFEVDAERKALVVMATGAGKTRTVVALVDVLMRAGWVKRVLFLADRTALVKQAVNAFKAHLPDSAPVNLTTDKHTEGRVYVSTYPSMMNLIDALDDRGRRRFGPGYFDLIVIDEAHRSVFAKYRGIFDYFDARLVGLTATPKDEVDRNTYSLFELETGVPTDSYSLQEKDASDALDWHEDGPLAVGPAPADPGGGDWRTMKMALRGTDLAVRKAYGLAPLSVTFNKLGATAAAGALIEDTLKWPLVNREGRRSDGRPAPGWDLLETNPHARDSLVCAITAAMTARDEKNVHPMSVDGEKGFGEAAAAEGIIWLHDPHFARRPLGHGSEKRGRSK
jgi:hypothetical protein